jgi:predicted nucleic-acid-binding protein
MIALDTNILVRYLLNDDEAQAEIAEALLASGKTCFIPITVWLELVWVLECYDCQRQDIAKALRHLLGLPHLQTGETLALLRALNGFEGGADFADALHVALSAQAESFVTFDQSLIKRAKRLDLQPPVIPARPKSP